MGLIFLSALADTNADNVRILVENLFGTLDKLDYIYILGNPVGRFLSSFS